MSLTSTCTLLSEVLETQNIQKHQHSNTGGDERSAMTIQCILRPHNDGHDEEDPIRLQELCDEQDGDDEEVSIGQSVDDDGLNHLRQLHDDCKQFISIKLHIH